MLCVCVCVYGGSGVWGEIVVGKGVCFYVCVCVCMCVCVVRDTREGASQGVRVLLIEEALDEFSKPRSVLNMIKGTLSLSLSLSFSLSLSL